VSLLLQHGGVPYVEGAITCMVASHIVLCDMDLETKLVVSLDVTPDSFKFLVRIGQIGMRLESYTMDRATLLNKFLDVVVNCI